MLLSWTIATTIPGMWYFSNPGTMRESRRRTSETESMGGVIGLTACAIDGPLEFPAWSNDDHSKGMNTAIIAVATLGAVKVRAFIGGCQGDRSAWEVRGQ